MAEAAGPAGDGASTYSFGGTRARRADSFADSDSVLELRQKFGCATSGQ